MAERIRRPYPPEKLPYAYNLMPVPYGSAAREGQEQPKVVKTAQKAGLNKMSDWVVQHESRSLDRVFGLGDGN